MSLALLVMTAFDESDFLALLKAQLRGRRVGGVG
jgi:hypothetical protein